MPEAGQDRVLGVFAKQPKAGQVKTRLAAATSAEWAARVASAFLLDTIERLSAVDARRVLAYAPRDADEYFLNICPDTFGLVAQADGDLGQRMAAFFGEQLGPRTNKVVLVGTDSPTMPAELIEQAFRQLDRSDVVFGPATDGGYYLVGCARRLPPIFTGISWSGSTVLLDTVACLDPGAWRLSLLPPWYDVDTADDWSMLHGHVTAMRRAGIDPLVPRTERLFGLCADFLQHGAG